jgi:hypothetical protein
LKGKVDNFYFQSLQLFYFAVNVFESTILYHGTRIKTAKQKVTINENESSIISKFFAVLVSWKRGEHQGILMSFAFVVGKNLQLPTNQLFPGSLQNRFSCF